MGNWLMGIVGFTILLAMGNDVIVWWRVDIDEGIPRSGREICFIADIVRPSIDTTSNTSYVHGVQVYYGSLHNALPQVIADRLQLA